MADEILNQAARDIWERIAGWWDHAIGEGNDFQLTLIMPTTDRLLGIRAGEVVLDACCGNGNYARRLGRAGAKVVAFDGSATFIHAARQRTTPADGSIEYHVLDATRESDLASLGNARFDAAVCSMAVMDLPEIDTLLRGVRRALKPGGRFVFSISHPCFNSNQSRMTAELMNEDGRYEQSYGISIRCYIHEKTDIAAGILHQPEPHYQFHRPISRLLQACFAAGFVVDAFEEPAFPANTPAKNAFSWGKRPEIPPAIVVRLRPA